MAVPQMSRRVGQINIDGRVSNSELTQLINLLENDMFITCVDYHIFNHAQQIEEKSTYIRVECDRFKEVAMGCTLPDINVAINPSNWNLLNKISSLDFSDCWEKPAGVQSAAALKYNGISQKGFPYPKAPSVIAKTPEYKVGDKVEIVSNIHPDNNFSIGEIVEIMAIDAISGKTLRALSPTHMNCWVEPADIKLVPDLRGLTPSAIYIDESFTEDHTTVTLTKKECTEHKWIPYQGIYSNFKFCEHCDVKKGEEK